MTDEQTDSRQIDRVLQQELQNLPKAVQPERDLWPGIAARIERPAKARPEDEIRWWRPALAVAATALVVMFGWQHQQDQDGFDFSGQIAQEVASLDDKYASISDEYLQAFRARQSRIDPAMVQVVNQNLAILDAAEVEIRNAVVAQPSDPQLMLQLIKSYQQKIQFLDQVNQLPEATRLIFSKET